MKKINRNLINNLLETIRAIAFVIAIIMLYQFFSFLYEMNGSQISQKTIEMLSAGISAILGAAFTYILLSKQTSQIVLDFWTFGRGNMFFKKIIFTLLFTSSDSQHRRIIESSFNHIVTIGQIFNLSSGSIVHWSENHLQPILTFASEKDTGRKPLY